ncbi:MAG: hypothetical protein HC869_13655, partial [Rhodospirillales bacterium]|nr:hypothetical protein [Rhodospirillales bacterium]
MKHGTMPRLASRSVYVARLWRNGLWALVIVMAALATGMTGYGWFGEMEP